MAKLLPMRLYGPISLSSLLSHLFLFAGSPEWSRVSILYINENGYLRQLSLAGVLT